MPNLDKELLIRKMKLVEEDLAVLKNYRELSLEDYLEDNESKLAVERLLEKITGRLIDINYHTLREEYEIMPEDYYSSFIDMGKNRVIDEDFANEIAKSAGLRNALAHEYEEIDQKMVYEAMQKAVIQVPVYLKKVADFIA